MAEQCLKGRAVLKTASRVAKEAFHGCRKFPVAEQKRPTLITYPGNTVSFVVQIEAWKATHLDKDLESATSFPPVATY